MKNQLLVICLALTCFGLGFGVRGVVQPQAQATLSQSQLELAQYESDHERAAYLHGYNSGRESAKKGEPLGRQEQYGDPFGVFADQQDVIWKGAQAGYLEASN